LVYCLYAGTTAVRPATETAQEH